MPHDVNGKPLREGDEVLVRCRVKNLYRQEGFAYACIETLVPMPVLDGTMAPSLITLNAGQIELVAHAPAEPGGTPAPPIKADGPKSVSA